MDISTEGTKLRKSSEPIALKRIDCFQDQNVSVSDTFSLARSARLSNVSIRLTVVLFVLFDPSGCCTVQSL